MFPWSLKLIYGLISDNIPICGYRRKIYLIFFSFVEFCAVFSLYWFEPEDPLTVALCLMVANISLAFMMVVSEAIMVTQCRRDTAYGSQDFVSLNFLCKGIGGITGCIVGGIITEYYEPHWAFFWYSWMGLVSMIFAIFLSKEVEKD